MLAGLILSLFFTTTQAGKIYQQPDKFLAETFAEGVPEPEIIWLTGQRKQVVKKILGHRYTSLRVRYWKEAERSVWILEEVGKDLPITVGLIVNQGKIERIKVLEFRESRGAEIRYPFFTDQFTHSTLTDEYVLSKNIDGISGATLSVRAMKKLASLALFLASETEPDHVKPAP